MQSTPEQRALAKQYLSKHLAAMGYRHPAADNPSYEMNADEPLTVVQAAIAAHKFIKPNKIKEN